MGFPDAFAEHIMPDKIHALSVSFLVDHLHKNFGGVAGNICYSLGLLGRDPVCFACAGKDAKEYRDFLKKGGVNVDYLQIDPEDFTGSFVVITDKSDSQIAGFYPGAMKNDVMLRLGSVVDGVEDRDVFCVISPTMPEAMSGFVKEARDKGMRYMFSPAQQIPRLSKRMLIEGIEGAEVLIGNDYEIALIEEKTGLSKKQILSKVRVMITTLGEKGSKIERGGREEVVVGVAKPSEVLDPTGAGDAYIAGFLAGYLEGLPLEKCGQMGATSSAYVLERYGTTGHSYSVGEFEKRMGESFG
jgi:adenosine kinase